MKMSQNPEFYSFILPFIITLFLAYIAYQQYTISRDRLRFDLFEKRFKVYEIYVKYISHIVVNANVFDEELFKFVRNIDQAHFLFNNEIADHFRLIHTKSVDLQFLHMELEREDLPANEKRTKMVERRKELLSFFTEEIKNVNTRFEKYLRFK